MSKEKANNKYKNLTEEEKKEKRHSKNRCNKMKENSKQNTNLFLQYKDEQQTIKFNDYLDNKREFHASKQAIALNLVDIIKIVISDKFKYSDDGSKYFIVYLHDDDVIRPLCIILPQISGYIKYFDNGGKNMSFKIEDEKCIS